MIDRIGPTKWLIFQTRDSGGLLYDAVDKHSDVTAVDDQV